MLSVFFSSKCSLFHNANLFGSCIIHILYTECAEIQKQVALIMLIIDLQFDVSTSFNM